jgi:ribA/ribD-fused uncharacterized protein
MARDFDPNSLNEFPDELILWFDDLGTGNERFRFLSNFYAGEPITLPGITWPALVEACGASTTSLAKALPDAPVQFPTGEHAFAAMKFWGTDWTHFADIVGASGPNPAKALGRSRQHPLREDWEVVKLDVMAAVVRAKFTREREEGGWLLDTGDALLVEGTYWHDEVWGVDLNDPGTPGRNWLGSLLMMRRAELRAMQKSALTMVQRFANSTVVHNAEFVR